MKIKVLIVLLLFSTLSFAQYRFNQFSLEGGIGYNFAGSQYNHSYDSNFSGFRHVDLGVRYMINENYGVRVNYTNDRFLESNGSKVGVSFNKYGIDGIYNLGRLVDLAYSTNENVGLLGHVGLSYVRATPVKGGETDRIGSISFGLSPQFKIGDNTVFYTDLSANTNIKQHLGYDGNNLYANTAKSTNGVYYTFSFGFMIYLGQNRYHADWY